MNRYLKKPLIGIILLWFCIRVVVVGNGKDNFRMYAIDYVAYQKNNENIETYDQDIIQIQKRILPSPFFTSLNPLKWTELQISEDDELLNKCKKVWMKKQKDKNQEIIKIKETFDERYKL